MIQGMNVKGNKVFCYTKLISKNKMIAEMEKEDLTEKKHVTNGMEKLEREILHFLHFMSSKSNKII